MEEKKQPYQEKRPWGEFVEFTKNEPSTVKILIVNPREAFSLQKHLHREEFWRVLEGEGKITIGEEIFDAKPDDQFFIKKDTNHRIEAGENRVVVLEISFGQFDENDIVRLKDKYGRI